MKPRSPVLGYNHNVRYAARVWHVQTEDSGVQAPHIYTHLFHDGTILASKKTHYDPIAEVAAVQKLMQSQHKAMLRELKSGVFDPKIIQIYGPIVREAGEEEPALEPAAAAPVAPVPPAPAQVDLHAQDDRETIPDLGPLLPPPAARPPTQEEPPPPRASAPPPSRASEARVRASLTPSRPSIAVAARSGHAIPAVPTIGGRTTAPVPRTPPPTIGSGRSGAAAYTNKPTAEGVVVARPTVIVGKDGGQKRGAADFWKTEARSAPEPGFGGDLISEKSLDEVILAYLSEDVPKK